MPIETYEASPKNVFSCIQNNTKAMNFITAQTCEQITMCTPRGRKRERDRERDR